MYPAQGTPYPQPNLELFLPTVHSPAMVSPRNYFNLLEALEKTLEKNIRLRESLEQKAESLRTINSCETLTSEDQLLYNYIAQLCEQTERIELIINRQFSSTQEAKPSPFTPTSPYTPPLPPRKPIRATSTSLSASSSKLQAVASLIPQPATMVLGDHFVGKAKWETYFEDVGNEPALPSNIAEILDSPCPIWKGEKVRDTHALILVTATINQRPRVLRNIGDFIQSRKAGHEATITLYGTVKYKDDPIQESYWLLITRKEVSVSRDDSYDKQKKMVEALKNRQGMRYLVPNLLEITTFALAQSVSTGKSFNKGEGFLAVRCAEKDDRHQLVLISPPKGSTSFLVSTDKSKKWYTGRNVSGSSLGYHPECYLLNFGVRAAIRLPSS